MIVPRRHLLTRYLLPLSLLAGLIALAAWAGREYVFPPQPVTVAPVFATQSQMRTEGTPLFKAAGWIEPRPTPIRVAALAPGVVDKLLVVEDQPVKKGQEVALLIRDDAQLAFNRAEATERLRQAELSEAQAELTAAQTRLDQPVHLQAAVSEAEAMLAKVITSRKNLPYETKRAESRLALAQQDYDGKLNSRGVVSGLELDRAKRELDTAQQLVGELKNRDSFLKKEETALVQRRKALETQLRLLADEKKAAGTAKAKVAAAQARLDQAKVDVAEARLRLDRMKVRAPDHGRVYKLLGHPGARIGGGGVMTQMKGHDSSTVVTLYQPGKLQVRVDVRFVDLPKVRLNQKVRIENAALEEPLIGEVLFISSIADIQKNTLEVKVAIPNAPPVFKPEMLVDVTFLAPKPPEQSETPTEELRIYIPKRLVKQGEGGSFVWVADQANGVARRTPVTLGVKTADDLVEITSGLTIASRIIATGDEALAVATRRGKTIGDTLKIGDVVVKVAGIYSSSDPSEENYIYTHLDFLQRTKGFSRVGTVTQFEVQLEQGADVAKTSRAIDDTLRGRQVETDTRPKGAFQAKSMGDLVQLIEMAHYLGFACVGLVLALVATTTVMSVQDRIKEHAVLQSIGFSSQRVFCLVLLESVLLSFAGGVVGVGTAMAVLHFSGLAIFTEAVTIAREPRTQRIAMASQIDAVRGPVRRADGVRRVSFRKPRPLFRKAVDIRRFDERVAFVAECAEAPLIGQHEQNVRRIGFLIVGSAAWGTTGEHSCRSQPGGFQKRTTVGRNCRHLSRFLSKWGTAGDSYRELGSVVAADFGRRAFTRTAGSIGDAVSIRFLPGSRNEQFGQQPQRDGLCAEQREGNGIRKQRPTADRAEVHATDVGQQPDHSEKTHAEKTENQKEQAGGSEHVLRPLTESREKLHRQQIEEAPQKPSDTILRIAVLPLPMMHGNFRHFESAGMGQYSDKAVKFAVNANFPGHFGSKQLEAAVVIVQFQSGQPADQPVEHLTGIHLVPGVEPPLLPAVDDIETFVPFRQELRNFSGIVLQVGVHHHDGRAPRGTHPGGQRGGLGKIAAEANSADALVVGRQRIDHAPRTIVRSVVDEDHLKVDRVRFAGGRCLLHCFASVRSQETAPHNIDDQDAAARDVACWNRAGYDGTQHKIAPPPRPATENTMAQRIQKFPSSLGTVLSALVFGLVICSTSSLNAGGGPENVVVVVNGDSWASRAVANEFIRLRAIPAVNVVVLKDLPGFESVSIEVFREQILKPVLAAIEKRGLKDQIDCIAYSSDLPSAIDVRADLGGRKLPRVITPTASINGLTHLYEQVLAKDVNYLQLNSNRYMRRPLSRRKLKPIAAADRQVYALATQHIAQKKWSEAEKLFATLSMKYPGQSALYYNRACCLARLNKPDDAINALRKAVAAGWANAAHAKRDDDLKGLREHKQFSPLLKSMEANAKTTFTTQPTLSFSSKSAWNERGEKVESGGRRYLLSTMLAVTSGRGNSVSEAISGLKRSAAADFKRPDGTVYFLVNGNVRSRTRQPAFASAVAELKKLGVKAEVIPGVLPKGKANVAGAMIGTASFDWQSSSSTIAPGAICEHLTSFGGVMRERAGQTPLTELLRHGAAGASGTVTEPYAIQAKFPFPFLHVHYARGCSLAEAFYQSVAGPYQLLIVGDPLCQPWAKPLTVRVAGLIPNARVTGVVKLRPRVDDLKTGRLELFIDGRRVQSIGLKDHFSLDTRRLSDGHHEARIVAIRGDAVETQGRTIIPFVVNNRGNNASLASSHSGSVDWNQRLTFRVAANGAKSIAVMNHHEMLGTVTGTSGRIEVDTRALGPGPVRISAVAHIDGKQVRSAPIVLTIVPPAAWKPSGEKAGGKLANGLLLTVAGGKRQVVESTQKRDWLARLGVKPNQQFSLTGQFQIARQDVYQFQVWTSGDLEIKVDGRRLVRVKNADRRWQFYPVPLKPGRHRFELTGTASKTPALEIRFGGRGAQSLDGKRFQHRASAIAGKSSSD
eukprot:g26606.t1